MTRPTDKKLLYGIMSVVIAFVGIVYIYQFQTNDQIVGYNTNTHDSKTSKGTASGPYLSEGLVEKTTFQLDQNVTSLNVKPGLNVSGVLSLNILNNTPIRFYIDDHGFNTTKSVLPDGVSVSMQVGGKEYKPEFLSQISNPTLSKNPPIPVTIGNMAVTYIISVPANMTAGTYKIAFLCQSFEPNTVNKNLLATDESEEVEVNLNVE